MVIVKRKACYRKRLNNKRDSIKGLIQDLFKTSPKACFVGSNSKKSKYESCRTLGYETTTWIWKRERMGVVNVGLCNGTRVPMVRKNSSLNSNRKVASLNFFHFHYSGNYSFRVGKSRVHIWSFLIGQVLFPEAGDYTVSVPPDGFCAGPGSGTWVCLGSGFASIHVPCFVHSNSCG